MQRQQQVIDVARAEQETAAPHVLEALESGDVLHLPEFPFALTADEMRVLDESFVDPKRKNVSYDPATGRVAGLVVEGASRELATGVIRRYHETARRVVDQMLPQYRGRVRAAPTSLRLHPIKDALSWRKDDKRLHVDAFPSRPNYGERILRVFLNINPQGVPRVWRVGEPFEQVARHFLPRLPAQVPGSAWLLRTLHITKSRRSRYDHLMLKMHDAMKADLDYQATSPQQEVRFMPGSGWVCFSDQTSHAAMSGQFMLEQTFHLPPEAMADPAKSPLRVLERIVGQPLA